MAIPYQTDIKVGHPWRIILIQNDTFNLGFIVASKIAESISRTSPLSGLNHNHEGQNQRTTGKRNPKTNFVEARTFCHLYRSFDRLWMVYILAFQAMLIVAWSGSLSNLFNEDVSKNVLSIFITSAFLTFLQDEDFLMIQNIISGPLPASQHKIPTGNILTAAELELLLMDDKYEEIIVMSESMTGQKEFLAENIPTTSAQQMTKNEKSKSVNDMMKILKEAINQSAVTDQREHVAENDPWTAPEQQKHEREQYEDGDESATISGPFLQEDVLSLKGLEFILEQAEPAEAVPELAMASPSPLLSQTKSQLTKKL